jgi:glycosyltransferase involved in cell wall biosynthesis
MNSGTRRDSARWADPESAPAPAVDVLIPTAGRAAELAVTLAGLAAQQDPPFSVILSDQSDEGIERVPAVRAMMRVLEAQGRRVVLRRHLPRRGMAEQRQFLLDCASAERVLFLDDDVWLEPGALGRLDTAMTEAGCGLVGYAVQGLSHLGDVRPGETARFEPWPHGRVAPERVRPWLESFERWPLHNAANPAHHAREQHLGENERLLYRVAWIGACALFDRRTLNEAGGFDFWRRLPPQHAGEDRVAQWRVMERAGGAGVLPSGAVHLEAPTTVTDRRVEASDVVYPHDGPSAAPDPNRIGNERRGS